MPEIVYTLADFFAQYGSGFKLSTPLSDIELRKILFHPEDLRFENSSNHYPQLSQIHHRDGRLVFESRSDALALRQKCQSLHYVKSTHGNALEYNGAGILILGESGMGKTELCLQMLGHGYRFVADDMVELSRHDHGISLSSPDGNRHLLHPELGMINVPALFGPNSAASDAPLKMVICLGLANEWQRDTLSANCRSTSVLGLSIPTFQFRAQQGRYWPPLIETALKMLS